MNPVYATVIGAALTSFRAMRWDVQVSGVEHIPVHGPAVIATNHIGYADFVFVGAGARQRSRRRVRFVAKREAFDHRVSGPLMRAMRHISVDRGGDTDRAMTEVAAALAEGDLVGMFPEGTINPSWVPSRGAPGAARMAMGAGAPLIPGAVWGCHRIITKFHKPEKRRNIVVAVAFGPPIEYASSDDPVEVTTRLVSAIAELVDTLQRSYPQVPSGPQDRWWLPAHLGGTAPTPEEAARLAREAAERRRARRGAEQGGQANADGAR